MFNQKKFDELNKVKRRKLEKSFYANDDVLEISKDLLGKFLMTKINGVVTGGMIVETEAYNGRCDKACHAFPEKRTKRTEIMYNPGGSAYVYVCYGIHYLFNITTNIKDKADAVLVRAIEPVEGIDVMLKRRNLQVVKPQLTAGPGVLTQALGINKRHYGADLSGSEVWIEDRNIILMEEDVVACPRIGVAYAEEDALLPWRFYIKGNKFVSKIKSA